MNIFDFTSIKETGMSNWAGLYSQNIVAGKTDSAGFQAVLDQNMGASKLEELLKTRYPGLKYHVSDTSKINSSLWQRNDYPFEMFFEDTLSQSALDWKPTSGEPSMLDTGVQARLNAARGKYAIVVPPALEDKLENNPELSQSIMKKISTLIKEQDTVPSSMDSFTITLDNDGNISNYRLSGGGGEITMSSRTGRKKDEEKEAEELRERARIQWLAAKCALQRKELLQQVTEDSELADTKKFLDEKFHINTIVVDYSCKNTDTEAEMYDTAMLEKSDIRGGRNVIISKKTLLKMKKASAFRQKVYKSIEDIPWSSKQTGGAVKGNGIFIHEDGTGGYYLEFDWGDEEGQKNQKPKTVYTDRLDLKNLNPIQCDEFDSMGFPADVFLSLMGVGFNYRK